MFSVGLRLVPLLLYYLSVSTVAMSSAHTSKRKRDDGYNSRYTQLYNKNGDTYNYLVCGHSFQQKHFYSHIEECKSNHSRGVQDGESTDGVQDDLNVPPSNLEAVFEVAAVEENASEAAEPPASSRASRSSQFMKPAAELLQRFTSAAWGVQASQVEQQAIAAGAAPPAPLWINEEEEVDVEADVDEEADADDEVFRKSCEQSICCCKT